MHQLRAISRFQGGAGDLVSERLGIGHREVAWVLRPQQADVAGHPARDDPCAAGHRLDHHLRTAFHDRWMHQEVRRLYGLPGHTPRLIAQPAVARVGRRELRGGAPQRGIERASEVAEAEIDITRYLAKRPKHGRRILLAAQVPHCNQPERPCIRRAVGQPIGRLVDDVRTGTTIGGQVFKGIGLQDDQLVGSGKGAARIGVARRQVFVEVGAGQGEDDRAVRVAIAKRCERRGPAARVQYQQQVNRITRPGLPEVDAVCLPEHLGPTPRRMPVAGVVLRRGGRHDTDTGIDHGRSGLTDCEGVNRLEDLNDSATLREALIAARHETLDLFARLPADRWQVPYLEVINPPLWELAHIGWFQEYWCLRGGGSGCVRDSLLAGADSLFDSRVVPHALRWRLSYPCRERIDQYLSDVLQTIGDLVEQASDVERYFFQLALLHEDMHAEAMRMTLATLGVESPTAPTLSGPLQRIRVPGGEIRLGSDGADRFAFDNERPGLSVGVSSFEIASRVINNAEFAEFVDAGGLENRSLWTAEGWQAARAAPPRWQPWLAKVAPNAAAQNVSHGAAEAYCQWRGGCLASEAQWEYAARNVQAFYDSTGKVWEWTRSVFRPYSDEFVPGPYAEYSAPWFGTHHALRGGAWSTHPRLKYPQFRNFYQGHRDDVFAGIRVVWRA